ncbi:MAG: 3-keto-disaccharide hydrolase [Rhodospirillales bacterium]|jgi:hypothetical protein|tara:strand:+ start:765 stop:1514 length:750 start_codon:yes stop_codon:yes gene_type:complete
MKKNLIVVMVLFSITTCYAQKKEYKPEHTEVWEPVPEVVTPAKTNDQAPSDAVVLFDGANMDEWIIPEGTFWDVKDGVVTIRASKEKLEKPVTIESKKSFGSMQMHIEWRSPDKVEGEGQKRGNSGIFIQSKYELQIQDNYENVTYVNGQAGSIYKQIPPLVNACKKPGEWQTYDVFYTAPIFDKIGLLISPAYISVAHNGILVQNHAEIKGSIKFIGLPYYEPHGRLPLRLQDHGNPVSFKNIWVREL